LKVWGLGFRVYGLPSPLSASDVDVCCLRPPAAGAWGRPFAPPPATSRALSAFWFPSPSRDGPARAPIPDISFPTALGSPFWGCSLFLWSSLVDFLPLPVVASLESSTASFLGVGLVFSSSPFFLDPLSTAVPLVDL
jgi:hypothetical protein